MAHEVTAAELLRIVAELAPPRYLVVCRPEDEEPVQAAIEALLTELLPYTATFRIKADTLAPPGSVLLMLDPDDPRNVLHDAEA